MKKIMASLTFISLCLLSAAIATASVSGTIEDSAITTAIKAKMAANRLVSALDIKVETNKGIVALEGNVKTVAEADTAVEIASSVEGVSDVDTTRLYVQGSTHPITDSLITAKIKGAYIREKVFGSEAIALSSVHVTTNEGVVSLTGQATKAQADNAERLAKLVKGVKEVKSALRIKE